MSGGKFEGQFSGTWSTTRSVPVGLVVVVLVGVAVMSHLAAILRILAVVLAVVIVLAVPVVILMRRWTRQEYGRHLERLAQQPDEPRPAVKAPQPPPVIFHGGTHVHIGAGTDPRVIQALVEGEPVVITDATEGRRNP